MASVQYVCNVFDLSPPVTILLLLQVVREGHIIVDMKAVDNLKIKFWYFKINKYNEFILRDTLQKVCFIFVVIECRLYNGTCVCLFRMTLNQIFQRVLRVEFLLRHSHTSRYASLLVYA